MYYLVGVFFLSPVLLRIWPITIIAIGILLYFKYPKYKAKKQKEKEEKEIAELEKRNELQKRRIQAKKTEKELESKYFHYFEDGWKCSYCGNMNEQDSYKLY